MYSFEGEISKFTSIAKSWWKSDGPFKMLHEINPLRLEYILSQIKNHYPGKEFSSLKALDIGCGGGILTLPLSRLGFDIAGIDPGAENIEAAAKKAREEDLKVRFINNELEHLIKAKEKFDILICLEVLEHVENPKDFINKISQLSNPGSLIILSTLNRTLKSKILAVGVAEYVIRLIPRGTHSWEKFIKPHELSHYCNDCNIPITELKGMSYNVILQKWEISNDLEVNYFATCKGTRSYSN